MSNIYIAEFEGRKSLVKIGMSKQPEVRLAVLEEYHGKVLASKSIHIGKNSREVERDIHMTLRRKRVSVGGDGGTEFFKLANSFDESVKVVENVLELVWDNDAEDSHADDFKIAVIDCLFKTDYACIYKSVLVSLLINSYSDGTVRVGYETLSKSAGVSLATFKRTISKMKADGVVSYVGNYLTVNLDSFKL